MAAMKIPKQAPSQRRGVDPPSSLDTASPSPPPATTRVRAPLPSNEAAMVSIFPIPHMEVTHRKDAPLSPTRTSSRLVLPRDDPAPVPQLRSSMHKNHSSGPTKTVRYATVTIYEHDLDRPKRSDKEYYQLDDYEASRGPRKPPKFFQKSDEELKTVRRLREEQERQAEKEWRQIREDALSIQEEASVMGGSVQSARSEASSFAGASFYEGFEERFKVKKKKPKNLVSRFGRFFRRRSNHPQQRKSQSMIGSM